MNTQGIEVHYLAKGISKVGPFYLHSDNETGHTRVEAKDVERVVVAEWLESDAPEDMAFVNHVWDMFQNGVSDITGVPSMSESLGVRSMMMGDRVVLQTNNRGPKRVYEVAEVGFLRV